MVYIIVLNWNSEQDTLKCIESLLKLKSVTGFKIIVCDNDSKIESFDTIKSYLEYNYRDETVTINEIDVENYIINPVKKITLVKNICNYGYAGGNNVGLKLALNQVDMQYAWVLNNDTEVDTNALTALVEKMTSDENIGICGSRLVEMESKHKVQALGGVINPWFCTTKEIGSELTISDAVNESEWENKIDFVIGASLFFSRVCLKKVGLLCEDYFLYYEEVDYCNRIKENDFKVGIASKSIVFHEHGASTCKGKSEVADFCAVRNRLIIAKKFYQNKTKYTKLSLVLVVLNRLKRREFLKAKNILALIFGAKK